MNAIKAALFHFRVAPESAFEAMALLMARCNRRPLRQGFDDFGSLVCPALPDNSTPVAAAMAVSLLSDRHEPITENFRRLAQYWFQGSDDLDPAVKDLVKQMIQVAWSGSGRNYVPLPNFIPRKGFHEIVAELIATMPKKLQTPDE
jgi:hypothetical protein